MKRSSLGGGGCAVFGSRALSLVFAVRVLPGIVSSTSLYLRAPLGLLEVFVSSTSSCVASFSPFSRRRPSCPSVGPFGEWRSRFSFLVGLGTICDVIARPYHQDTRSGIHIKKSDARVTAATLVLCLKVQSVLERVSTTLRVRTPAAPLTFTFFFLFLRYFAFLLLLLLLLQSFWRFQTYSRINRLPPSFFAGP